MSLKAKLEAVIYAAEEPVTLAQLSALFATDALEWKAQQEALSAEHGTDGPRLVILAAEPLPMVNGELTYVEESSASSNQLDQNAGRDESAEEMSPEASLEPKVEATLDAGSADASAAGEEHATAEDAAAMELEARRLARIRDREARVVIRQLLDELIATYASDGRGIEIREIAGGYRMATKPECHDAVRLFVKSLKPALRLSLPALETLAVIAYKQPVTAPEVNEIRGVDSSAVFGTLLARKLITTAGRKQVIGRPILYKTTREFLLRFGLKDVTELPSMEEFEKMAAIELDEPEPAGEAGSEPAANPAAGPEFDETASEAMEDLPENAEEPETAGRTDSNETESAMEHMSAE